MKKSKKIGIIFIILSLIIIAVAIIFALMINKEKTTRENIEIVKQKYTEFSVGVVENYNARSQLIEELGQYSEETLEEKHKKFTTILTSFNASMVKINTVVDTLEDKCSYKYEDSQTNIFCENYQQLYESVNNAYVGYMKDYNDKITKYNENSMNKYELFELINKDYIDFNKDGNQDGKLDNNK